MIRIFALDMDGTLLDSNSKLSEDNIKALRDLESTGVRVVLASGRVFKSVLYFASKISTNPCIIANNGALLGSDYDNLFFEKSIDDKYLDRLYDLALENDLDFHFYDLDTYYSNKLKIEKLDHLRKENDNVYTTNILISDDPLRELRAKNHKAYKFQINKLNDHFLGSEGIEKLVRDEFSDRLYMTSSFGGVLELMSKGVSKFDTLLVLADKLGFSRENIATIGDGLNDLEMTQGSKLSFAMGNGREELKEIASHIVSDNNSGGIREACEIIKEYNRV